MQKSARVLVLFSLFLVYTVNLIAQERVGTYQIRVVPNKTDWTYELNQPAKFTVSVTLNNIQTAGLPVKYSCGLEAMPPTLEKSITTTEQPFVIEAGTMKEPGFLRCIATMEKDGKTYRGLGTAGYAPEQIKPTVEEPKDFDQFWEDGKKQLAKLPIDAKLEPLPSYSTPKVDVYQVSFQNITVRTDMPSSRIYGILAIPKTDNPNQKFPALFNPPGAGVRPYRGLINLAERGIITLQIGIHGLPVTFEQSVYDNLNAGGLAGYPNFYIDNKNNYYYRRVYLGCIRANDFLTGLPQFNGKNLGVIGSSQGGGLAIVTAALDPRVTALAVSYPALSDMTGYIHGRAGGWFHVFKNEANRTKEKIETLKYYDAVNFARRIKVPGIYSWGFNDEVCPPTSMHAALNVINAPKTLLLGLEQGHSNSAEQAERINLWIENALKQSNSK